MSVFDFFSKSPIKIIKNALKNKGIHEIVKETTDTLHVRQMIDFNTNDVIDENIKDVPINIIIDFPVKDSKTGKKFIFNMNFVLPIPINEENHHFYEYFCNKVNNCQFFGGCFFICFKSERITFRNAGQMLEGPFLEEEAGRILSQGFMSISAFLDIYFNHEILKKNEILK